MHRRYFNIIAKTLRQFFTQIRYMHIQASICSAPLPRKDFYVGGFSIQIFIIIDE